MGKNVEHPSNKFRVHYEKWKDKKADGNYVFEFPFWIVLVISIIIYYLWR